MTTKTETDFLAFVNIMGGGSWARNESKSQAIRSCLNITVCDWSSMFKLDDNDIHINVFDVQGYDSVRWGADGIFGWTDDEAKERHDLSDRFVQQVVVHTPPLGKAKSMNTAAYKRKLNEALLDALV